MPELPEVEIAGRNLRRWMVGRTIVGVEPIRPAAFQDQTLETALRIEGHRVLEVVRRGKVLWLESDGAVGWLVRFGMTGKWVRQLEDTVPRHTRVLVHLDEGVPLCFVDMRNFGGIWGLERALGPATLQAWVTGIDPVLEGLRGEQLEQLFAGRSTPVKVLLMEQSGVAGVGNIYASEAPFQARIHPCMPAKALDAQACARLARTIVTQLEQAIVREDGEEIVYFGEARALENPFQVYQREGQGCGVCGTPIVKVVLGQRSTFFCPECQAMG